MGLRMERNTFFVGEEKTIGLVAELLAVTDVAKLARYLRRWETPRLAIGSWQEQQRTIRKGRRVLQLKLVQFVVLASSSFDASIAIQTLGRAGWRPASE
jgi:hypothetical protein